MDCCSDDVHGYIHADEDYSDNGSAVKDNEDNTLSDDEDFCKSAVH